MGPAGAGALLAEVGVAQDAEQVAQVVFGAQEARLAQDARERLLHKVVRLLARSAEAPRRAVQPVDVIAEGLRIELPFRAHAPGAEPIGPTLDLRPSLAGPTAAVRPARRISPWAGSGGLRA